jgi:hypothetical protein
MRIPVFLSRAPECCAESGGESRVVAYLLEGNGTAPEGTYAVRFTLPATRHFIGCACCAPRGPAAAALGAMFRARATGAAPYFHQVVTHASPAGIAAVRGALADDAVAAARFRYVP